MRHGVSSRYGQRGWAGVLTMLLALLVVMLLAVFVLKQYVLPNPATARAAGGDDAAGATAGASGANAPMNAVERARGLDDSLRQQAQDMGKRIDAASTGK